MKNFWNNTALALSAMVCLAACEREVIQPQADDQASAQVSQALPQGASHAWRMNLPALYTQAQQLDEAQWVDWSSTEALQDFPVVRVRRSEMLKPNTPAFTTDGKNLTPAGTVQAVVVDGETRSGGRARFVIDRRNVAGWYEDGGERMFFESTDFGTQSSEAVRTVLAYTEAEGLKGAAPGNCGGKDVAQAECGELPPAYHTPPHPSYFLLFSQENLRKYGE